MNDLVNAVDLVDYLEVPSKEYSPMPFWFWNDELSEGEIERQMLEMKDKGVDGFVIHPRKGLPASIPYLSDVYFRYVRFAVAKARDLDMKVVLYDEAMYPSGSCHGEVVKADAGFASMCLMRAEEKCVADIGSKSIENESVPNKDNFRIIARLTESGREVLYIMAPSGGTIRGVHENEDDGEVCAPKSADLLNPKAVAKFIELTHERYYKELKDYFGSTVIAIFTDEPGILGRCAADGVIPWSDGIYEEYIEAGGRKDKLGSLFTKKGLDYEIYKKVIYERLSRSYYEQLGIWCARHNVALTGHPEKSTDIGYLKYFQIPCQDIVWRFVEPEDGHAIEGEHSTMGKCSSDSARHRGIRRNGNECFGCCGHRSDPKCFTQDDMRWYLNWLFVRGVNMIYPHAFYYSIRDGRGDERPPEVGMHNPFWPWYHKLSDYIKRMCYLNTESVNMARVAIVCSEDSLSWKLAKPLYTSQIEFNYLERELLGSCNIVKGKLNIKNQEYTVVVSDIKEYEDLTDDQKAVLHNFERSGGRLIIADEDSITCGLMSEDDSKDMPLHAGWYIDDIRKNTDQAFGFEGDTYDLRFTHLVKGEYEYIFLSNEGLKSIDIRVSKGISMINKIWNPYTDECISQPLDKGITIRPYELFVGIING